MLFLTFFISRIKRFFKRKSDWKIKFFPWVWAKQSNEFFFSSTAIRIGWKYINHVLKWTHFCWCGKVYDPFSCHKVYFTRFLFTFFLTHSFGQRYLCSAFAFHFITLNRIMILKLRKSHEWAINFSSKSWAAKNE